MMILPSGADRPDNPRIGYDNLVADGSLSSDQADSDFPVDNLGNGASYPPWKGENTNAQTVTVNLGSSETIDYLGLARHNFGTAGITYTLEQASSAGGPWSAVASSSPSDDTPIFHQFAEVTDQYFRLSLTSGSAIPELAVWYLGQVLVLERRIYVGHRPMKLNPRRRVSTGRSESGQFLGRVRRAVQYEGSIEQNNIDPDWYRNNIEPFIEVIDTTPFFFSWRPSTYPDETMFCWSDGEHETSNQRSNGMMRFSLPMKGLR